MVTIEAPENRVCYQSSPVLKCTFEEVTDSAGWRMSNKSDSFELNNGSVVLLNPNCATGKYKSCTEVTLRKVPGVWAGRLKCLTDKGLVFTQEFIINFHHHAEGKESMLKITIYLSISELIG